MTDLLYTPVAHGYTMHDLDHLARTATSLAFARAMDYQDRYEAAWHAIATTLCTADTPPQRRDLIQAGMAAIAEDVNSHKSTHGIDRRNGAAMPHFQRYWELTRRSWPSPEDMITERAALAQIWAALTDRDRAVLTALATHRVPRDAAAALGTAYPTYKASLHKARRAVFALWHEHETPSRLWVRGTGDPRSVAEILRTRRRLRARQAATATGQAAA